jgi:hypothetical protein
MSGTTETRSRYHGSSVPVHYEFDTEADPASGAEAVAEEVCLDEATPGRVETGIEAVDPSDHNSICNDGETGDDGEGVADTDATAEAADTEATFETDAEWAPDDRFPRPMESAGEEATLDAYFAEAADTPEDAREFLPIPAALVPVVNAAMPVLVSTLAHGGRNRSGGRSGEAGRQGRRKRAGSAAATRAIAAMPADEPAVAVAADEHSEPRQPGAGLPRHRSCPYVNKICCIAIPAQLRICES